MSDRQIEQEIQAKGLTAPRVTQQHINDVIASEHYFTAADGVSGELHSHVSAKHPIVDCRGIPAPLSLLTFCVLTLENGFTVTGESACASPENFDAEIGRKIARDNAINKVWMLEGYLLKQRLHEEKPVSVQLSVNACQSALSHVDRMRQEHCELCDRLNKLDAFINTSNFKALHISERNRMLHQLELMEGYYKVLGDRINCASTGKLA
ncbi:Gp49 family protein [Aeromonas enteropelogenes]|uniref:Gp49 family protein n=1 Tax=Aeromonas enteropelogenes TaxID=29489 RepID=UPI002286033D|nr:Gp49 family protein [Aeromonas enteropelogenes]MCZ0752576.1 Gp49 family protein [Aeromonas enteropelogenes]